MTFRLTQEAAERPRQTIHAAEVFHMNARTIAAACAQASEDELVVAVVSRAVVLAGVWTLDKGELAERMRTLDDGGWSLVFSPRSHRDEIEGRCLELGRSAFKRWEALRRWDSKHS